MHGLSTLWFPMCGTGSHAIDLLHYLTRRSQLPISSSGFCTNPSSSIWVPCSQTEGLVLCFVGLLHPTLCTSPGILQFPPALCVAWQSQPRLSGHCQRLWQPRPLAAVWKMGVVVAPTGFWQHLLPSLGSKGARSVALSGQGFHYPPSSLPAQPCHCNLSHISGMCLVSR